MWLGGGALLGGVVGAGIGCFFPIGAAIGVAISGIAYAVKRRNNKEVVYRGQNG